MWVNVGRAGAFSRVGHTHRNDLIKNMGMNLRQCVIDSPRRGAAGCRARCSTGPKDASSRECECSQGVLELISDLHLCSRARTGWPCTQRIPLLTENNGLHYIIPSRVSLRPMAEANQARFNIAVSKGAISSRISPFWNCQ